MPSPFCAVLAAILIAAPTFTSASDRPNIVLFLADNWAWPHAGALGDPAAITPTFDRIVREGALFDNVFCRFRPAPRPGPAC